MELAYFGAGEGQIVLNDVRCNGNETRLANCSNGVPNCLHTEDVGVVCQGEVHSTRPVCHAVLYSAVRGMFFSMGYKASKLPEIVSQLNCMILVAY